FYEGRGRPLADLCAAAIMMAVALLSHYDAIYVAPALIWLVLAGGRRRGWRAGQWAALAAPVGVGAGLLASFYVPFVLHPHFSEALAHIGERTGQQGSRWALYNNLSGSYDLAIFYNTTPAVIIAAATLALTLAAALVSAVRPRPLGWLLAGSLLVAVADILRGPEASLLMGQSVIAALALGLPILALAVSPATPAALRAALIWFGAACISVSFLLDQPRTHMHVMDVPAALILGYGVAAVGRSRRRAAALLRPALGLAAAALAIIAAPYAYALFVRQSPEYQRGFPMAVIPAYPALSGEVPAAPIGGSGRLGYPAQDGWKVIGELYRTGVLSGPFASNQSTEVASWYTRGLTRCGEEPRYYIIAMSLRNPAIPTGYTLLGLVQADGHNRLLIYSRQPASESPQIFDSAQFLGSFDAQPLPRLPDPATICGQRATT
ncbi:hypothetical protein K2Z83_28380, partial [Oscillochloris sp. ZM17-4]|uniref:hypothetical protein n=1 Tax=Oscillochloris sp. ZM17-4 TaxID=2866714 RepID=UPI001C7343ED